MPMTYAEPDMPTLKLQWPTRKAWANHQTAGVFYDANNPYAPIPRLSAYAGRQEIAGAIAALKAQYRDLGHDLRHAPTSRPGPIGGRRAKAPSR